MNEQEKTQKVIDFIKAFDAIEQEIKPYKESLKDLKTSYKENGWLTGDEIRMAIKAYRMLRKDENVEELQEMYNKLLTTVSAEGGANV